MASRLGSAVDRRVDTVVSLVRAHPRRLAAGVLVVALFLASVARDGIPLDKPHVLFWVTVSVLVVSARRVSGWWRDLLRGWAPLLVVLFAYDWLRGYADRLNTHVHYAPQLPIDDWLGHGQTVAARLQHVFWSGHPRTLDYVVMGVYLTHFVVAPVVAAILWVRDRAVYRQYAARLAVLFGAGVVTFAAYPAAPPWMAAQTGRTAPVHELVTATLTSLAGSAPDTGAHDVTGHGVYNPVAAVPSLHAAIPMLLLLFFFFRVRRPAVRALLLAYPPAMGFALVYTGAHFVFDIVLGWVYAATVVAAFMLLSRRAGRQASQPGAATTSPPAPIADPASPALPAASGRSATAPAAR